eukprot:TRINITY_DN27034_c0_g1_i1.p1 TRINITY_DN27034_c0_g1~~TRINITY_DN27034_c0_g1_i1.p1  ORF type:complete len:1818 (+),score=492.80 TRINITY_DN27034_c0_g1_i1:283-5454(+)
MDHFLQQHWQKQAVFVVPTISLARQQALGMRKMLAHSGAKVAEVTGAGCKEKWTSEFWENIRTHQVLVVMHAILLKALESKYLRADDISLVVFDEAHHAVKGHPYVLIAKELGEQAQMRQRVLGLTASYLHGRMSCPETKRLKLEEALRSRLWTPSEAQLAEHAPKHRFERCSYDDSADDTDDSPLKGPSELSAELLAAPDFPRSNEQKAVQDLAAKAQYVYALLGAEAWRFVFLESVCHYLQALEARLQADAAGQKEVKVTGKVEALLCRLEEFFDALGEKLRCIIFVEQAVSTLPLAHVISKRLGDCLCCAASGISSMTSSTREQNLNRFRDGTCPILVTTNAMEEGIDVPACNVVVRFDAFYNVKSHIQGAGRARMKDAVIIYFENDPESAQMDAARMQEVARRADLEPLPPRGTEAATPEAVEAAGGRAGPAATPMQARFRPDCLIDDAAAASEPQACAAPPAPPPPCNKQSQEDGINNAKCALNEFVIKLLQRSISKTDVFYVTSAGPTSGTFVSKVRVPRCRDGSRLLEVSGEACTRKMQAEQSAAAAALAQLMEGAQLPAVEAAAQAAAAAAVAGGSSFVAGSAEDQSLAPSQAPPADAKEHQAEPSGQSGDAKSKLCQRLQSLLGRPVTRSDVIYSTSEGIGPFTAHVTICSIGRLPSKSFTGEPQMRKQVAEQSAAGAALEYLERLLAAKRASEASSEMLAGNARGTARGTAKVEVVGAEGAPEDRLDDADERDGPVASCAGKADAAVIRRAVPSRLRLSPQQQEDVESSLYLHVVELQGQGQGGGGGGQYGRTSSTLGLLLPCSTQQEFSLFAPGEEIRCNVRPLQAESLELKYPELLQVAIWSAGVLSMFRLPLPHLAAYLGIEDLQLLELHTDSGELRPGRLLAKDPDGHGNICFLAVPLTAAERRIDWELIKDSLPAVRSARFPGFMSAMDMEKGIWTHPESGKQTRASELIVGARVRDRNKFRRKFLAGLGLRKSTEQAEIIASSVLHRFSNSSASPLPPEQNHNKNVVIQEPDEAYVVPLPAPLARAVVMLPGVIWHLELLLGSEEVAEDLQKLAADQPPAVDAELVRVALTRAGVRNGCRYNTGGADGLTGVGQGGPAGVSEAVLRRCRAQAGRDGERLEFLGDAVLKFIACTRAFLEMPAAPEGELHDAASAAVSNEAFRQASQRLELPSKMFAQRFGKGIGSYAELQEQKVTEKAPADVLEAIVGALWLSEGGCLQLEQRGHYEGCIRTADSFFRRHIRESGAEDEKVGRQQTPLLELLSTYREAPTKDPLTQLQRVEFLGDAVLQVLVSEYLFFTLPRTATEGDLSIVRSWLVGNVYQARRAIRLIINERQTAQPGSRGLAEAMVAQFPGGAAALKHRLLAEPRPTDEPLDDLRAAAATVSSSLLSSSASEGDAGGAADGEGKVGLQKCFADVYEVLVGARFLNQCKGDLYGVWEGLKSELAIDGEILQKLLKEYVTRVAAELQTDTAAVQPSVPPAAAEAEQLPKEPPQQQVEVGSSRQDDSEVPHDGLHLEDVTGQSCVVAAPQPEAEESSPDVQEAHVAQKTQERPRVSFADEVVATAAARVSRDAETQTAAQEEQMLAPCGLVAQTPVLSDAETQTFAQGEEKAVGQLSDLLEKLYRDLEEERTEKAKLRKDLETARSRLDKVQEERDKACADKMKLLEKQVLLLEENGRLQAAAAHHAPYAAYAADCTDQVAPGKPTTW